MVTSTAAARASRGKSSARRCHRTEAPMPDQGADSRGQGDRVVRVDDALGQADDEPGAGAASRPRAGRPARSGRCGGARMVSHSTATSPIEGAGDAATRSVLPNRREEQPVPARSDPTCEPAVPPAADAARLVAAEPAEAVVAEDEVEDAVVGGPADVGPVGRRRQLRRRPPTTRPPRPGRRP